MYFSDMYSDSQVSEEVREDDMLWGEGFGGALQWEELMEIATEIGFSPPMLVEVSPISIDEAVRSRIGMLLVCRLQWACIQYVLCVGLWPVHLKLLCTYVHIHVHKTSRTCTYTKDLCSLTCAPEDVWSAICSACALCLCALL